MNIDSPSFIPHPLIKGGHLQTILARLLGKPPVMQNYELLDVAFDNGDNTYIRIDHPQDARPGTPILALFHGLGGCSESPYKLRIAERGVASGLRVARFSHRGCGPSAELKAKFIYHSGSQADVLLGLKTLARRYPDAPIAVVGFSLSGAMVLNLMGHYPNIQELIPQLRMAAAVCPPIDLISCSEQISRLQNLVYDQYYSYYLIKHVKRRAAQFGLPLPEFSSKFVTLAKFDNEFTAPLAGFRDAAHYYTECSPIRVTDKISVPTLILAAKDDPVVNHQDFYRAKLSPKVLLRLEDSGGHMGFIAKNRTPFGDRRWLESTLVSWAVNNLPIL